MIHFPQEWPLSIGASCIQLQKIRKQTRHFHFYFLTKNKGKADMP
jgi:hypothetical protein